MYKVEGYWNVEPKIKKIGIVNLVWITWFYMISGLLRRLAMTNPSTVIPTEACGATAEYA